MYFFLNEGHGVWECFQIRGQSLCYLFSISSIKITGIFLYQKRKQEHTLCKLVCSHTCNYRELCHMNGFCCNSNIYLSEEFQKCKGMFEEKLSEHYMREKQTFCNFLVLFHVFSNRCSTDNFHIFYLFFSFHPFPLHPFDPSYSILHFLL